MRVVVIGCGRVGSRLVTVLSREGHDVVVVDKTPQAFETLGSEFDGETVTGTGIDEDVLRLAGIETAEACAAVTSDDNTNIMAAQVAKNVFQVPKVVARIYDPDRELIYHQLGLETVSTTNLGVTVIHNLIVTNGLRRRATFGTGEVELVETVVRGHLAGRTVGEVELNHAFRVAAVIRNGRASIPHQHFKLMPDDVLVGAANTGELRQVKAALGL